MLTRLTPERWRKGFALHRHRLVTDETGEQQMVYDMEHPDFTAQDGSPQAICWQNVQSWQNSGRLTSGWKRREQGTMPIGVLEGRLRYALEVSPFDRIVLANGVYEVRSVQLWPSHRKLLLQQIG